MNAALTLVGLFVGPWVVIFGGAGALYSHARAGSVMAGLLLGVLLGPLGWAVTGWRTRERAATAVSESEPDAPWPPAPEAEDRREPGGIRF